MDYSRNPEELVLMRYCRLGHLVSSAEHNTIANPLKGVYSPGAHIVHVSVFTIQKLRWPASFGVQIQLPVSPGPGPDPVTVALIAGDEE